jgi:hypothetical protein
MSTLKQIADLRDYKKEVKHLDAYYAALRKKYLGSYPTPENKKNVKDMTALMHRFINPDGSDNKRPTIEQRAAVALASPEELEAVSKIIRTLKRRSSNGINYANRPYSRLMKPIYQTTAHYRNLLTIYLKDRAKRS